MQHSCTTGAVLRSDRTDLHPWHALRFAVENGVLVVYLRDDGVAAWMAGINFHELQGPVSNAVRFWCLVP